MERKYILLWVLLLGLLAVSLVLGGLGHVILSTALIFLIAVLKAWLVAAFYMRLKWEPRYVAGILIAGVVLMVVLYFTLIPDIVHVYGG